MRGKRDTPAVQAIKGQPAAPLPEQLRGIPHCPTHLDATAKREWNRIAGLLNETGLLTTLDGGILALYCVAYSRWITAEKGIKEHGIVQEGKTGLVKSPYVAISAAAMTQMLQYIGELGLSPNARSRIKPEKKEQLTTLDRFLVA